VTSHGTDDPTVIRVEVHLFVHAGDAEAKAEPPEELPSTSGPPADAPGGGAEFNAPSGTGRASRDQHALIGVLVGELADRERELGRDPTDWPNWCRRTSGVKSRSQLDVQAASRLIDRLAAERDRLLIEIARRTETEGGAA
jgi:hypothetical protein